MARSQSSSHIIITLHFPSLACACMQDFLHLWVPCIPSSWYPLYSTFTFLFFFFLSFSRVIFKCRFTVLQAHWSALHTLNTLIPTEEKNKKIKIETAFSSIPCFPRDQVQWETGQRGQPELLENRNISTEVLKLSFTLWHWAFSWQTQWDPNFICMISNEQSKFVSDTRQ